MPTKLSNQTWILCGYGIQRIAHMETWNRASRAFKFARIFSGKSYYRAMKSFLHSGGQQPNNPLMPTIFKQREAPGHNLDTLFQLFEHGVRFDLHLFFDGAPVAIDLVQLCCQSSGFKIVICK